MVHLNRSRACPSLQSGIVVIVCTTVTLTGAAAIQNTRTVPHQYGVPLSKQAFCAGNERIYFPRDNHGAVLVGEASAEGYVDYALDTSDVAIVFMADEVQSLLIENDSWISTRVSGFVEEVLSSRKLKLSRYSKLSLQMRDGAMAIDGCQVITGDPVPIEPGHRYLVFFNQPSGPYAIPTVDPILIRPDGRLESASASILRGASLDMVRERIRIAPSRGRL